MNLPPTDTKARRMVAVSIRSMIAIATMIATVVLWAPLAEAGDPVVAINQIQGSTHLSPFNGLPVDAVTGIVTATTSNGYFIQSSNPDSDDATSEGLFVFTSIAPTASVGDSVSVDGTVAEFRPGGAGNLTITELTSPTTNIISSGNLLPAATVVGQGGRIPPTAVIEDDATGDVEASGVFDPATDGIDFYESLEGMRVKVDDAVAVGPTTGGTSTTMQLPIVGNLGTLATTLGPRSSLPVSATDFNPERIIVSGALLANSVPAVRAGTTFDEVHGVMDYGFANFRVLATQALVPQATSLDAETATPAGNGQLAVASMNLRNLEPGDTRMSTIAHRIVDDLGSPDLIALQEVQDNNGPTNDSTVSAGAVMNELIAEISTAEGPTYAYRQINPVDDQDGGLPGANIRNVFLYRTDHGVAFTDIPGGSSTTPTSVIDDGALAALSASPGRIDPTNTAWNAARKPLVGQFTFGGKRLFVINTHFTSKGSDDPLFGRFQPPTLTSEAQRTQQAQIVNNFVDELLTADPSALIVVLGDMNDYQFSTPLATLEGSELTNLTGSLPVGDRYTYRFDGNALVLDHMLVSSAMNDLLVSYDAVHTDSDFSSSALDHDPIAARFSPPPKTVSVTRTGTGTGTVTSTPSGISCGDTCSSDFDHGTVVTLSAVASAGSKFTGWSGAGCSGTGQCVVTATKARSVTATFAATVKTPSTLSLTYSSRKDAFKVTVGSAVGACFRERQGTVWKKRPGTDSLIGNFISNAQGIDFVESQAKGRFYAKVKPAKRTVAGTIHTCKAAISNELTRT